MPGAVRPVKSAGEKALREKAPREKAPGERNQSPEAPRLIRLARMRARPTLLATLEEWT